MEKIILDWNKYIAAARAAVAEGIVLLENNGALPLKKNENLAVFGRIQEHYYKSGTGSGGMVNVDKVWNITETREWAGAVSRGHRRKCRCPTSLRRVPQRSPRQRYALSEEPRARSRMRPIPRALTV